LGVACKWGRGTFGGSTTCEGVECGKFVAKFQDDSLGRFFSKTFEFG
jgi:hypothetical protein